MNKKWQKIITKVMASLLVCLLLVPEIMQPEQALARDSFVAQYIQTVYNQKNGIGSNELNCLFQSSSGYIWAGTDGGLYRSDGSGFQIVELWDSDRPDAFSINCIIQDVDGKLWIGTDNYGLFCYENGETYHFLDEYYNGVETIIDLCESEDGEIYVATSVGLFVCEKGNDTEWSLVKYGDASVADDEFMQLASYKGKIWALCGSSSIYILGLDNVEKVIDTTEISNNELNCLETWGNRVYIGTSGNEVICYLSEDYHRVLSADVDGINHIMQDSEDNVWVCADNGMGYFDHRNAFHKINDCEVDSYLSDMIQDYEGNYWIASYRMGLLYLAKSKFVDFNLDTGMPETMVNYVYLDGRTKYVGTDDGLFIYNGSNEQIENELTDMLSGISVRHITKDSEGNLWIGTYRRYGVVKVNPQGEISNVARGSGLPSISINYLLELDDGNIAVGTDDGVAIMDKEETVTAIYGNRGGLSYNRILCLFQDENGRILAGTDGEGIYAITPGEEKVEVYTVENGLNSNVVSSIEEGNWGLWIGTDNGLCFYNETFRNISNVEFSNSIYDVVIDNGFVWLIGSMGILRSTEEELLGNQDISGRYMNANDGLLNTINTSSNSVIDGNGNLYICCNNGLYTMDTRNIPYNLTAPKIRVTSVDVDGVRYVFDDLANGLEVSSDASRITINFAVFSYSNRDNIRIRYSLNGFDEEPIVLTGGGQMEAVYTNLDGGSYEFTISAYNGDGTYCQEEITFLIEKEKDFTEQPLTRFILFFAILLSFSILIYTTLKVREVLRSKNTALEQLSKEHEEAVKTSSAKNDYLANMSNEIKTPINAIMLKAEELRRLMGENDVYRETIDGIYNAGNEIIAKVDDIILLAKIEAGRMEVLRAPYSVSTMMYELSENVIEKISDAPVKFFVEIGENIADNVIGDSEKIKDVLSRLLDNAIKYTREGSVTLAVDCYEYTDKNQQDMVNLVFTVSDTGNGIQEERLEDIFEIYNIEDNRKNNPHSGNGVGLAIAKGYADLMGGELQVESVYGAGSTFTLSLYQKSAERLSRNMVIPKIEEMVSKEIADKLWLPEVNALLVDDEENSREVSLKTMEQFEMKVDVASSGVSAIDMVMNNDYDVVLMDLIMPIMSGTDAMKEIRELDGEKYAVLPIISLDNDAIEGNKEKLLEEGFTDSLVKPIDVRRLAAILKDCLPESKIKEKSNDIAKYIEGSRYAQGLYAMQEYLDVESAVEKIGGSIDIFNKLILAYYRQNNTLASQLQEKFGKDLRNFKTKVRALKNNSLNIGAYSFAKEASRIEAAINRGNKDYIKKHLDGFIQHLEEILDAIAIYQDYMESVSGMTDEEYAQKIAKEQEESQEQKQNISDVVDFSMLESVKYEALENNFQQVEETMKQLLEREYAGEDQEFIHVLAEAVEKKDVETIDELVTTYMDLKM